jgi:hypothetical protein
MALPQQVTDLESVPLAAAVQRVRRCTYRRLGRIGSGADSGYEVSCLYPDRRVPLPIGDPETSLAICWACTANHTFRPDED